MVEVTEVPIKARVIIEVVGKPKEHVEDTMNKLIDKINEDENLEILNKDIAPIKEKDEFFSTFAEMDIRFNDLFVLTAFCFNYMPGSVEVIEPEELKLNNRDISSFFNDLQNKLHNVDMVAKKLNSENKYLKINIHGILKNFLNVLLRSKQMDAKELCKYLGTDEGKLLPVLDNLVKKDFLKKEGEIYSIK